MAKKPEPKKCQSKRSHRRNSRPTCSRVSGDRCGDTVGFSLSERRRCKGRRQAETAGVTPRIARSISNVHGGGRESSRSLRSLEAEHPVPMRPFGGGIAETEP